jgi:glucose/arabinose dehydrogenase
VKFSRTLVILGALGALVALAPVAGAATTRVAPASQERGARVAVAGTDFGAGARVSVVLAGRSVATARANRSGNFSVAFRVPRGLGAGTKALVARSGRATVRSSLRVVTDAPLKSTSLTATSSGRRVLLSPTSGRIGERVTLKGSGFPRNRAVRIEFGTSVVRRATTTARGTFTAAFDVPTSSPGRRAIAVVASSALRMPFRVPCGTAVSVCAPYALGFDRDAGGLDDRKGIGTGFTMALPNGAAAFDRSKVAVAPAGRGRLLLTTTAGLLDAGTQENALGVGLKDLPGRVLHLRTTILNPPTGTGGFEQGGLWFAIDQNRFFKLVVVSTSSGLKVEHRMRPGTTAHTSAIPSGVGAISLDLRLDAEALTVGGRYRVDGGAWTPVGEFGSVDAAFFNFDGAGIDPTVGSRSFAGVFASHRNGPSALTYAFDGFSVSAEATDGGGGGTPGPVAFTRTHIPDVNFPTSMVVAKDGRLYVTELLGRIHAFSFNAAKQVVGHQVINTLGNRMPLGITEDPASTAANTILWVSHGHPPDFSKPSGFFKNAPVNSGIISRLRKSNGFARQDVITGLPRSANDHAVNNLHFGPDGRLFIAVGGNTGAGAAWGGDNEFPGLRAEQPLSAAIIVAAVKRAGFNGDCGNEANPYAKPPCQTQGFVTPYGTGLRNSYDFVFHPNGSMYATDNGLGLNGMFPPSPTAPCNAAHSSYNEAFDPAPGPAGVNDWLFRVTPGSYHGHPNPTRGECVWMDGSKQGVGPSADYSPPVLDLGTHRSANSMIVYRSRVFGGSLRNELLIGNYAKNTLTRTRLSGAASVASHEILAVPRPDGEGADFGAPLGLARAPDGTVFVGETQFNRVAVLRPNP